MTSLDEAPSRRADVRSELPRHAVSTDAATPRARITSIDAVRGVVIFTMIVVNLLAGIPFVPWWLHHLDAKANGITVADSVYPAFLFIVGMSIPFALGSRLKKGEPAWRVFGHVLIRVASLLMLGVMMVNGRPDAAQLGWSPRLYDVLMYTSGILAFCTFASPTSRPWQRHVNVAVRVLGFVGLIALAFAFRGKDGARIITLSPFFVNTEWWGILGGIAWAYLVGAVVFLLFRDKMAATVTCFAMLLALYVASASGAFSGLWIAKKVSFGTTIGTHGALTVGGLMIGILLSNPATKATRDRIRIALWMIAGFALAAWLLNDPWGVSKIRATPSFTLWCSAITTALWLALYVVGDVYRATLISRPLAMAGQNVLLAYLISQMFPSAMHVFGVIDNYYAMAQTLPGVIARASFFAVLILALTWLLNRVGFSLKL